MSYSCPETWREIEKFFYKRLISLMGVCIRQFRLECDSYAYFDTNLKKLCNARLNTPEDIDANRYSMIIEVWFLNDILSTKFSVVMSEGAAKTDISERTSPLI